ncbi:MAG: glutamine amidotransferase-related protein [Eggerthellaceae bacterium]
MGHPGGRGADHGSDGVFPSNGPGDPRPSRARTPRWSNCWGRCPCSASCLGHQMIAKAAGADIEKLKFGHRGGNHPS